MCMLSGENATALTPPECPLSGSPIATPVAVFQIRIVSSSDADTTKLPSGDIATAFTLSVWPVNSRMSLGQSTIRPCRNLTVLGNC